MKHACLCFLLFTITLLVSACGPAEFSAKGRAEEGSVTGTGANAGVVDAPPPASVAVTDPVEAAKHECGNGHNDKKTAICHVPQGNPDNRHTLCLPASAIESHLREHNASAAAGDEDHLGACK